MPESETSESNSAAPMTLSQFGGLLGIFTAVSVGFATITSWGFARGLIGKLGFPASVVTLKTSLDIFSAMALIHVEAMILVFVVCYSVTPKSLREKPLAVPGTGILSAVLLFLLIPLSPYTQLPQWRFALMRIAALFSPGVLGFMIKLLKRSSRIQIGLTLMVAFLSIASFQAYLYEFGARVGTALQMNTWKRLPVGGLAEVQRRDFPKVTIRAKEPLSTLVNFDQDGGYYVYPRQNSGNIRLVLHDDSNYYFVENVHGNARSFAVRSDLVSQLIFMPEDENEVIIQASP
jgi:hypothetical protein